MLDRSVKVTEKPGKDVCVQSPMLAEYEVYANSIASSKKSGGPTLKRHQEQQKTLGERLSRSAAQTWLSSIVLAERMRKQHPFLP